MVAHRQQKLQVASRSGRIVEWKVRKQPAYRNYFALTCKSLLLKNMLEMTEEYRGDRITASTAGMTPLEQAQ